MFILFAILPFFLYLRGSLGTDEGCFLFIGDSILHGSIPYKDYIDIKPPGIYYLFALAFSIFGKSFYAARAVTFIFNALSAVIIFSIGRKLWNKKVGMLSSMLFLIGMLTPAYEGYLAMTEPFMVFFGLLGVLLFFKYEHRIYLILTGLLIGISTLFKQYGALFLATIFIFYLLKLWMPENRTKDYLKDSAENLSLIICGFLIPIAITAFYFWTAGSLQSFIYWSFLFGIKDYGHSFYIKNFEFQFLSYSIIWVLSFVSVFIIAYEFTTKKSKGGELFTVIWLLASLYPLTIKQYGHYYIQLLPPACLLASISLMKIYPILSLRSIKESLSKLNHQKIFAIVCLFGLILSSFAIISYTNYGLQKSRQIRFDDQLNTAEYIKSHTSPNEKILAFNYVPSMYFLSDRDPPTEFLFFEPWFGEGYEYRVIERINGNSVRYVVCNFRLVKGNSAQAQPIYEYIQENYEIEKVIGVFYIYRKKV